MEEAVKYIRCRTCGRHVEENQSLSKIYCSKECAGVFTRCPNCGNFFEEKTDAPHNGFCSLDCETLYGEDGIIIAGDSHDEGDQKEEQ